MEQIKDFLNGLRGTSKIEFNNLNRIVSYNDIGGKNIYFCCGLEEKLTERCKDEHIKTKKYFFVDIDIRLCYYLKNQEILSDGDMYMEIMKVLDLIKEHNLDSYSCIVHSGNGIHLYYTGEERSFDKTVYSQGVQHIYGMINDIIGVLGYECDRACHNISRITRIPGSINTRKKDTKQVKRDLGEFTCEIMYMEFKNSPLFENIESYAIDNQKEIEKEKDDSKRIKEIIQKEYKKYDDIRKQINEIPACDIACDIWGVTVSDKGLDNVTLKEQHKNMGAYWYKPKNIIVNTGSSLIKTNKSYFTSYELVLNEMFNGDKTKTLDYFKTKYNVDTSQKKTINIPKLDYQKTGYLYGNSTFDKFECCMSGELVIVCAETNTGKTTFAMDMLQKNYEIGKKGFYINLEFDIKTVAETRRLFLNKKTKTNLTDIAPLTYEEEQNKNKYVKNYLSSFDYYNNPQGISINDLIELIMKKKQEGYCLIVVDTFSRIQGNLDNKISHTNQNECMEKLQTLCQNIGVCVLLLHHTNKKGEFEGSQKIKDLSNVFITIKKEDNPTGEGFITKFLLSKDKFVSTVEIDTVYENKEYKEF